MNRRHFVVGAGAIMALPSLGQAYTGEPFSPTLWRDLRKTSETVILNYRASWSLTCQIKADIIARLLEESPAYGRLVFVDVDWDTFGPSEMTRRLGVQRRSTLVVMQGGKDRARLENQPYERKIRALLDEAVALESAQ